MSSIIDAVHGVSKMRQISKNVCTALKSKVQIQACQAAKKITSLTNLNGTKIGRELILNPLNSMLEKNEILHSLAWKRLRRESPWHLYSAIIFFAAVTVVFLLLSIELKKCKNDTDSLACKAKREGSRAFKYSAITAGTSTAAILVFVLLLELSKLSEISKLSVVVSGSPDLSSDLAGGSDVDLLEM